jgi:hypothetical protein
MTSSQSAPFEFGGSGNAEGRYLKRLAIAKVMSVIKVLESKVI